MAARKLQGEIEKTFKKVDEGNELFDETWDKVYSAETPALREKFEAELKKEIKKLQRQRDKIKNWIAGNEVKDKKQLIEYRKDIETRMEKFKQCERESKMKAYSKEGLSKSTAEAKKRAAKGTESPLKKEIREWLEQVMQSLQEQLDESEEELKTLQKSRKPDKSQLDALEERVECHKKYLKCLNDLTELHEDDHVTPEEVQENVQESVDFYISDNQNPDFVEDESVVDWIKEKQAEAEAAAEEEEEEDEEDDGDESDESEDEKPEKKPVEKKPEPKKEVEPVKQPEKVAPVETKPVPPPAKKVETPAPKVEEKPQPAKQPVQQEQKNQKQAVSTSQQKVTKAKIEAQNLKKLTVPPVAQPPAPTPSFSNLVNNLSNQKAQQEKVQTPKSAPVQAQPAPKSQPPTPTATTPVSATPQPTIVTPQAAAAQNKKKQQPAPQPAVKQPAPAPQKPAPVQTPPAQPTKPLSYSDAIAKGTSAQTPVTPQPAVQPPVQQQPPVVPVQQQPLPAQQPMHILPEETDFVDSLGQDNMTLPHQLQSITSMVSGLQLGQEGLDDDKNDDTFGSSMVTGAIGSLEDLSSQTHIVHQELTPYQQQQSTVNHYQSRMLDLSLKNVPHLNDTDKPKQYIAQNPYPQAPDIFPTEPSSLFNDPTIISKMDLDTLFFIFYFQQGTYQQYLAAKELKKQAWRFHKKYLTWFQRHDLPKHTTNDYELGTYVYFDYETGWCQRIKSGFRFEYEYLEDENF